MSTTREPDLQQSQSATMSSSKPITFYDISAGPSSPPFAPNPWKTRYAFPVSIQFTNSPPLPCPLQLTRSLAPSPAPLPALHSYALNFVGAPHVTQWVPLPEVGKTRASLGLAPCRTHPDGSPFPTLPIIHDHSVDGDGSGKGTLVGDSFDIALHLHAHYGARTAQRALFPPGTTALHRAFNAYVDDIFSVYGVALGAYWLPLDPATADVSRAEFMRRYGLSSWEDLKIEGEARAKKLAEFEAALGGLAKCFERRDEGPFLEGRTPMYADLIVGAWLQFAKAILPEWETVRGWHGGLWGRLFDALEEFATVS